MWWHTVTHRRGSKGGNWRMEWVANTLHTTSEHGVSNITTADAHTSAASSRLNWRPPPADLNGLVRFAERRSSCRQNWRPLRPFRRKTKSGFCACAITFQTQCTIYASCLSCWKLCSILMSRYVIHPSIVISVWKTCNTKLRVRMFFLMTNTWCSKHVEHTKSWIKTLIWKVCILLVYIIQGDSLARGHKLLSNAEHRQMQVLLRVQYIAVGSMLFSIVAGMCI